MKKSLPFLVLTIGATLIHVPSALLIAQATRAPIRFLTADPAATDYWPCFSPDGKTVLFSRSLDGGKTWALFTIPVAGGLVRRVSGSMLPVSANRPNWSTRNRLIAFTGEGPGDKASVWVMAEDGSQARQIVATGLSDNVFYPSWYPDGKSLAVVDFGADDRGVVKRVDLDHRSSTALTDSATILAGMPSVSPDGKSIAFAGQRNLGQQYDQTENAIWLRREGGGIEKLEPGQGRTPSWSSDGRWLAFESNRGGGDLYAAFVIRRDGSALGQVTDYEVDANHPVWSPDGKLLVFSARHTKNETATGIAVVELRRP